ncbi:hypothetical protein HPG69_009022 [Diceros bicornis minor]|uniref:Calpain catalytic domain-containing protein n=1 Tax=Diceros bicornis minor TaxID=77932 RepID=A0A7J7EBM5_DICBM|nr:hypothetical protein HPG69_009022 [Diceros bicornis minor]
MAHSQKPLARTPIIKVKGQDFNFLQDRCLSRGLLFEDETFPAKTSSIVLQLLQGQNLSSSQRIYQRVSQSLTSPWKARADLTSNKDRHKKKMHYSEESIRTLVTKTCEMHGVGLPESSCRLSTLTEDCWFLAVLGSLTEPTASAEDPDGPNLFTPVCRNFPFPILAVWPVGGSGGDDHLPVLNKDYLFEHPRDTKEFWPRLLEKAYAKFRGAYLHLHSSYLPDTLGDLRGGVITSVTLHSFSTNLVMMMKMAAKASSLMTCATLVWPKGEATGMESGLVSQQAYTVTRVSRFSTGVAGKILSACGPPGATPNGEGTGGMECHVKISKRTSPACIYVTNFLSVNLDHANIPHERWSQMMFKNLAIPGNTAEGHAVHILCAESLEANNVVMSLDVMPQNLKAKDKKCPLSFNVFKCALTKRFSLNPGTYVVVITAYKEAVEFLLRIFLKMPDSDRNLGSDFNLRALKASLRENGFQQNIFYKYAHQGLDIDATQLQGLLNQEFLKGPPGDTFSLDECQSIMALMDQLKVNGRLDQEEFSRLWGCLVHYQNTQENTGVFLSSDLWKAIKDTDFLAGISISNELLVLMTLRYSHSSSTVSFPSLVCFLMRLEVTATKCHLRDILRPSQ